MNFTPPRGLGGYRLASLIQLVRNGPCWTLLVDGQKFPFLIDRVIDARMDTDEIPSVTITLIGDRVQVDNHSRDHIDRDPHPAAWPTTENDPTQHH